MQINVCNFLHDRKHFIGVLSAFSPRQCKFKRPLFIRFLSKFYQCRWEEFKSQKKEGFKISPASLLKAQNTLLERTFATNKKDSCQFLNAKNK